MDTITDPLDVWVRFTDGDDETAEAEANTFATPDGGFRVEWYLTAVGMVTDVHFDTLDAAHEWLTAQGFADFTA